MMTESMRAMSYTVAPRHPIVSLWSKRGTHPSEFQRSREGLNPAMPQFSAGILQEPPVSDPRPHVTIPAAIEAAVPDELPPGLFFKLWGLRQFPYIELCPLMLLAISGMLVLATTIAPAFFSISTTGASCFGLQSFKAGVAAVVKIPSCSMLTLTTIGSPSSGLVSPSAILLSDSAADASADSYRTSTHALMCELVASILSREAFTA